jgi:hypothetical protein
MPQTCASEKSDIARLLANAHLKAEPGIRQIFRLVSDREQDDNEPVKLLEVNPATSESGIFPIAFSADPPTIPFPSVVIEVTENELDKIQQGSLSLPDGWHLGEPLHQPAT